MDSRRPLSCLIVCAAVLSVLPEDAEGLQSSLPAVTGSTEAVPQVEPESLLSVVLPSENVIHHLGSREPSF